MAARRSTKTTRRKAPAKKTTRAKAPAKKTTRRKAPAKKTTRRKAAPKAEPELDPVEEELLNAIEQVPQEEDETAQAYRKRVVKAATKVDDDVWKELSDEAQKWVNDGVKAIKAKKSVGPFGEEPEPETDEDEGEGEGEEEAPAPRSRKKAPAKRSSKKAPAKKTARGKAKAKSSKLRGGAIEYMRRKMIKNPDIDPDDLWNDMVDNDKEVSDSTFRAAYWHTIHTLRVLADMGLFDL